MSTALQSVHIRVQSQLTDSRKVCLHCAHTHKLKTICKHTHQNVELLLLSSMIIYVTCTHKKQNNKTDELLRYLLVFILSTLCTKQNILRHSTYIHNMLLSTVCAEKHLVYYEVYYCECYCYWGPAIVLTHLKVELHLK